MLQKYGVKRFKNDKFELEFSENGPQIGTSLLNDPSATKIPDVPMLSQLTESQILNWSSDGGDPFPQDDNPDKEISVVSPTSILKGSTNPKVTKAG